MLVSAETDSPSLELTGFGRIALRRLTDRLRSPLVSSMSIITVSMAVSLLLQMLTFAIIAGSMGPRQFGAFATVAALAAITGSFSGWGSDQLLLRRVGRAREELPRAMATSLVFLALSAPPLVLLCVVLVPLAIDDSISWQIVLFVGVSDIALARVNTVAATCFMAVGRPRGNAWLSIGLSSARLLTALLWIVAAQSHDALSWSSYYLAVSTIVASLSLWRLWHDLGGPEWKIAWHEWRDGFHFALQTASLAAFGSTDKPVIAALSSLSTAGIYAAANRLAMAAAIPVRALLYSAYIRFFQLGVAGPRSSALLAIRLLPLGIGLGALGAIGTLVIAPFAPRILGHGYMGTASALLLLAPVPIFYAIYCLGLDVLVSTGHTGLRTLAQIAMPPINILFCWLLVPSRGASGAALAALLTHASLAIAAWVIVGLLVRRQTANAVPPATMDEVSEDVLLG
jgi:O-antigen/teichoic acid export membrane protein